MILSRAISCPREGSFFREQNGARHRDHLPIMLRCVVVVNARDDHGVQRTFGDIGMKETWR
jgi:hypothetical protein